MKILKALLMLLMFSIAVTGCEKDNIDILEIEQKSSLPIEMDLADFIVEKLKFDMGISTDYTNVDVLNENEVLIERTPNDFQYYRIDNISEKIIAIKNFSGKINSNLDFRNGPAPSSPLCSFDYESETNNGGTIECNITVYTTTLGATTFVSCGSSEPIVTTYVGDRGLLLCIAAATIAAGW